MYLEKANGGLSDARNYGLSYATGEYIAFLDSDDYIEKKHIKKCMKKQNKKMLILWNVIFVGIS